MILLSVAIGVRGMEYSGLVSPLPDVHAVCGAAAADPARRPLLAGVDPYDDTTFNPRQAVMVIAELENLAAEARWSHLRADIAQLIAQARLLVPARGRPQHRRLVFNGD